MKTQKFKAGDVVIRINCHGNKWFSVGDKAVVIGYDGDDVVVKVCNNNTNFGSYEENLRLATKLEKALT